MHLSSLFTASLLFAFVFAKKEPTETKCIIKKVDGRIFTDVHAVSILPEKKIDKRVWYSWAMKGNPQDIAFHHDGFKIDVTGKKSVDGLLSNGGRDAADQNVVTMMFLWDVDTKVDPTGFMNNTVSYWLDKNDMCRFPMPPKGHNLYLAVAQAFDPK